MSVPNAYVGRHRPQSKSIAFYLRPQVSQLAGYVSEHSAYHHGETSLAGTIVGLANDFVGSNNVNILVPSGKQSSWPVLHTGVQPSLQVDK